MPGPDQTRYYVTTPIYYVNDAPHIGHAYTTVACDVLARFKRLDGTRVHFLTGTDDHGQKVEKSAQAAGTEPQAFTDQVSGNFRRLAAAMNCTNDDFIRTTETRHKRSCQAIWRKLMDAGEIYLSTYAGWYAVRDEAFYGENELAKQPLTAPYSRPRGLRSNGSRSRPISSGCRPGATGCSSFTKRPASSCPKAGATRSSPS
jgi:methionyl-tRNA synthetase